MTSRERRLRRFAQPLLNELDRIVKENEELGPLERALADLALGSEVPLHPESHLAPGVPRIRPVLVILASQAAGGDLRLSREVAFSAEFLHLAVVVHDAALGRQDGRRRRIARRLLGGAAHWLGGHHLTLRALEVARAGPAPELLGEVLDTVREITEGHALGEELRGRDPTEKDWREWAESHMGAVFAFCTRAAGRLAEAPRPIVAALGRYGRHMGVAWVAVEDQALLGLAPDELPLALAHRAATGRPLLPLVHALAVDEAIDPLLDRVLALGDPRDARALVERIQAAGGAFHARKLVLEETLAARRALRAIPPSPYRDTLDRLAVSMAQSGERPPSNDPS